MKNKITLLSIVLTATLMWGCQSQSSHDNQKKDVDPLTLIASSENQWTGIAVSKNKRIFVNYPAWSDRIPMSVAEIVNGKAVPYPSEMWNASTGASSFHAVQSVVCDGKNRLWVLDTNNKQFKGVKHGGPVLYAFDLSENKLIRSYNFPEENFFQDSYYNDVRIDIERDIAYITDSGHGGIIVLDIDNGESRRLLTGNKSVNAEVDHLVCDGYKWENVIASDGIALTPDNAYLYYIALSSHSLYRIKTDVLLNKDLSTQQVEDAVEKLAEIPATDGMLFDRQGNLWLGGLESNGINVYTKEGKLVHLLKDDRIRWADSFAKNLHREIFFTTSQIHLPEGKRGKYEIYKVSMSLLDE